MSATITLPPALTALLSRLPVYPGSLLFAGALNLALAPQLPADVRTALQGRRLRIEVTDARIGFDFEWRGNVFAACSGGREAELTIGASGADFLALAQRREDPDTLFFSRRLSMEGDTELGLMVKNTLDAIDGPLLDLRRFLPARLLQRLEGRNPTR